MADTSDAESKDFRTIAMIIDALEEHEQNLDKSIDSLSEIIKQVNGLITIADKLGRVEKNLNLLEADVKRLVHLVSVN